MNSIRFSQIARLSSLLLSLMLLIANLPAQARGGDDWVLVERFEAQLKQAQGGVSQAMYDVGIMYEQGRGTKADPAKAIEWLQRAVTHDNQNARARLGMHLYEGKLVARNLGEAHSLLQIAAEANVPSAQFYLAQMYETGQGVESDPQQALHWYGQALKGGYYQARGKLNELSAAQNGHSPAAPVAASPKPVSVPVAGAAKPAGQDLLSTLLNGDWQRNNNSAGFLPSRGTSCERIAGQKLRCRSGTQQRDTGYATITYMTQAVLTQNGSSNGFDVQYRNTVLNTAESNKQPIPGTEANATSSVSRGQQTDHTLECKLESTTTVVCVKDKITTQTFTNMARAQ